MRLRLRQCREALTAFAGDSSPLQQLYSALSLINPWVCNSSGACVQPHHYAVGAKYCTSATSSTASEPMARSFRDKLRQNLTSSTDVKAIRKKPPDIKRHRGTQYTKDPGLTSSSAKRPVRATAASGSTYVAADTGRHHIAAAAQQAVTKHPGQESCISSTAAAPAPSSDCKSDGNRGASSTHETGRHHTKSIDRSNSSSSSIDAASSTNGGRTSSLDVPSPEATFQTYPLPACPLDDEERDSLAAAKDVIAKLQGLGYKAMIVGGWVRDKYLGRRASDIDISTNATPWELKKLFRDVIELPRSTVKLNHQGEVLEVTCFRGISRTASMFSAAMDAARRDFTINALYYDPIQDMVLDCVGGVADAQQRILRLTGDSVARLAEDPLRVLRSVRFISVIGLRMAPATAQAVRQHAHLCSVEHGLPARRIWLELRKLRRAEQQQPGSWARALKLCYHLGLLHHIFPWLQNDLQLDGAPFGSLLPASTVRQQAVLVAERLGQAWQGRDVPLGLMVAATLHPASSNRKEAYQQLEQYFAGLPDDLAAIQNLLLGAALAHGSSSSNSSGSDTLSSSSSSSTNQDDAWVKFYASEHAAVSLDILAAWIPDAVAGSFKQLHEARMHELRNKISHHRQVVQLQQEQQQQTDSRSTAQAPLSAASLSEAVQQRRRRQKEELAAAIQALAGEQKQQLELEREQEQQELLQHSEAQGQSSQQCLQDAVAGLGAKHVLSQQLNTSSS